MGEGPVAVIWRNRSLIQSMVRRDIQARYRGSFGDAFWTVLHPLLLMAVYYFVFGIVLRARFAGDPSRAGFVLYFFAGMLPWLAFSEAAGRAPSLLLENRNLIKKIRFPVETLPANLVFAGLVTQAIGTTIFLLGLLAIRGSLPVTVLWIPLLLIPQVLFTLGMTWLLSAVGIFARDLAQMMGFLLTLWFFLTPICYPEASLPGWSLFWLSKNPVFQWVRLYRTILLEGGVPGLKPMLAVWLSGLGAFALGFWVFSRLRKSFADVV